MSKCYDIDPSRDFMKDTLKAIIARINGEFDNPCLRAKGTLMVDKIADIERFAVEALDMAESYDEFEEAPIDDERGTA